MPNLVSRKERIDALELLGATYVDKKRDMMGALECWKQAMDERFYINIYKLSVILSEIIETFVKCRISDIEATQ